MSYSQSQTSKVITRFQPYNDFVIIDDDSCHNIVCALSLKKAFKPININIVGFTNVFDGIHYLETITPVSLTKTVLFLDIKMPHLSGWDVLDKIEAMPASVKRNLIVYMLSSSIKAQDKKRAFLHSCVKDCIEKPLSDHLLRITEELAEISLLERMSA